MADYKLDYAAFRREVLKGGFMRAEMLRRAEAMKAFAESIAPYYPEDSDGHHYKDAFKASLKVHGGIHGDRVAGILRNTDPAALFVEYGSQNNPEHATLRKSLDAAG